MADWLFANSSTWLRPLGRTTFTVGIAYMIGLALRDLVVVRLVRMASRTRRDWDDIVVTELRRRVPIWSLLVGARIALDYWVFPQGTEWRGRAITTLYILTVVTITLAASHAITRIVASYGARVAPSVPVTSLTQNVVRLLIITPGVLVILHRLGLELGTTLATFGVGGLAVALALQEPLSNLFAGLFVTLAGQVRIGDYVKLDSGAEGYLIDFNWRSTRLQVPSGNVVIVPNAKLSQAIVTNFSLPMEDLAVPIELAVAGGSDLEQVERVTVEVAREVMTATPGGVPDFVPVVRYHTVGDGLVHFTAVLRARENGEVGNVRHEFLKRVHVRYHRERILTPAPGRTFGTVDPLRVAVVERPDGRA